MQINTEWGTIQRMVDETILRNFAHLDPTQKRFWAKVDVVDDETSCWVWTGACAPNGYGRFEWRHSPFGQSGTTVAANRASLYFTTGEIPRVCCHTCDVPRCVRPSHLYSGTHKTNARDREDRGRGNPWDRRGQLHPRATLSDDAVITIRTRVANGETEAVMANEYGVSRSIIRNVVTGRTWIHVGGPTQTPREYHRHTSD
jgi:hypothetical protein